MGCKFSGNSVLGGKFWKFQASERVNSLKFLGANFPTHNPIYRNPTNPKVLWSNYREVDQLNKNRQ